MPVNLFDELKNALQDFKDFLHPKVTTIKPAVQALALLVPQINELLNQLSGLLGSLKTEIQNLDVSGIPGVADVSTFTEKATAALQAAKNLLPDQAATINQVLEVAGVVTSLPSLDQVKGEIIALLDTLIDDINSLKAT